MNNILIKPVITERSMTLAAVDKYTFIVNNTANKNAIRQAVESAFKVDVTNVLTTHIKGKTKRVGKRRAEKAISSIKKAVVFLKPGQKISLFELSE
jgi:large subunit ribosomal protein L23